VTVEPTPWTYSPVPAAAEKLFRMCWQLENWLRTILYVELRAGRTDWETPIRSTVRSLPPSSLTNDKRLHHMATPHQAALSYLTFGQLWDVISTDDTWKLFEPYFPPKDNVQVKIAEVKAIRNRTAHFREPHCRDVARLELFMSDLEHGIRKFCNRYTQEKTPANAERDPVVTTIKDMWEQEGYAIELMLPIGWLYAPGYYRARPLMNGRLAILTHDNYSPDNPEGVLYRITVQRGNVDRHSNTVQLFNLTKQIHQDIVHFGIRSFGDEAWITIPAVLGVEKTATLACTFLSAGLQACCSDTPSIGTERSRWPEYVLWPDHMLNIFSDDIQDAILAIK